MPRHIAGLVLAAALVATVPVRAFADPVTVTGGGWFEVFNIDGGGMSLISDEFNIEVPTNCAASPAGFCGFPTPSWIPGQTVDFSATTTHGFESFGTGTVNGVLHQFPGAPLSFAGTTLQFNAASVTIPVLAPSQTYLLTAPFVMNGILVMAANGQPLFSSPVTGTGQFAINLVNVGTSIQANTRGNFIFGPVTPPTTPEPASLVLIGTGVLGLFAVRIRGKYRTV